MVKQKIKEAIAKYNLINNGDTVIIGLSGGPDSLCLFDVLVDLRVSMDLKLHGAHVNHQFRPGNAEEDQLYVENLCQNNGVANWTKVVDCNKIAEEEAMTSEEAGRKARYDFFDTVANAIVEDGVARDQVKIAIAHNLNDQAETVLFRVLRGTGTDGLAGIEYSRTTPLGNTIIRPLLDVTRGEIEEYCEQNNLEPRIDQTNFEPIYARNKIRLELIPYLEKHYNSNVIDTMNRLSHISKVDKDYIWIQVEKTVASSMLAKSKEICKLKLSVLQKAHNAVLSRVIMKSFGFIGLGKDITYSHLEQCIKIIREGQTPNEAHLPNGYVMQISYEEVIFIKSNKEKPEEIIKPEVKIKVIDRVDYVPEPNVAAFDYDAIAYEYGQASPVVRRRESGDYIRIKGLGRKKIQNLFVDLKVPKEHRDKIFYAVIGREVLYIPGKLMKAKYNDKYKVTEDTKSVITVVFQ
ncbi:MAG: tRNA lysidine(34) synthetase TilS [Anaerovoracaceae bacterium]